MPRETVRFDEVTAIRETDKALLCDFGDGVQHWIPKSQIDEESEVFGEGDEGVLVVSQWIAEEKGLL